MANKIITSKKIESFFSVRNMFFSYTLVGIFSTITHFLCLYYLVDVLHILKPVAASIVAFLIGAMVGFSGNKLFVFKKSKAGMAELSKYLLLTGFSGFNNSIFMYCLINLFNLNYILSQVISTACIYIINYLLCKFWIFRESAYVK